MLSNSRPATSDSQARGSAELSVILVNWNSRDFLRKCLASLYGNPWDPDWEVVVIDNASYDGSGEMLAAEFPQVRFLQGKENIGFAAANNAAFAACSGKNVLFLNPDTEVVGPALRTMLFFLQTTPDAGAVGARLLNTDLTVQTSCIQRFPTILDQALDFEFLRQAFPKARLFGTAPLFEERETTASVEVISGACLMVRREIFERAGRFSTRYFMYAEDVDLCYKIRRAGWKNYFVGGATVIHHGGGSTGSDFANVMTRQSLLQFLAVQRGTLYALGYRASMVFNACARLLLLLGMFLAGGAQRRPATRASLRKWYKILRWATGLEGWAGQPQRKQPRAQCEGAR